MKKRKKMKFLAVVLLMTMMLIGSTTQINATEDYFIEGTNENEQDYTNSRWADTVNSYLSYNGETIMRVQAPESYADDQRILVEYYDLNYQLISQKIINAELPIFGAFHESDEHYYILSGQANLNENDSVEVFRITKYDKNWNRIKSVGLYGANTTIPFTAGSARMTDNGEYLLIRTSHQMYTSSDGLKHQANVTIQVNIDEMEIVDSFTDVMNVSCGYVSHSFNQFIEMENDQIVAVDHGDAYPRSIVLIKYPTKVSEDGFFSWNCQHTNVISFSGAIGNNTTGASVGAFEVNDSSYLIAGNYVGDGNDIGNFTKNIFVASVSKDLATTNVNWITNYTEGYVSTPHMVFIGNGEYMLLWTEGNYYEEKTVCYTKIDKNGKQVGEIYRMQGTLSDCVPVLISEKLVWYTASDKDVTFYEINCAKFIDVDTNMYYHKPVYWAFENGITTGWTENTFAPENSCTRGQVVTFLWRAMGEPEPKTTENPFTDVKSDAYYYKAVLWALENNITKGFDETHFAPDETVTRGQFVTFLHRTEETPSYNTENPFKDVEKDIYYYDAVLWAFENEITTGLNQDEFGPNHSCTRGQVVTFLYRALDVKE